MSPVLTKEQTCWRCGGAGTINRNTDRCPGCAGTGLQARPARRTPRADQPCGGCGGSGYRVYQREVPDGSGRIETVTEPCGGCGGSGRAG